jgi:hypothetical protein
MQSRRNLLQRLFKLGTGLFGVMLLSDCTHEKVEPQCSALAPLRFGRLCFHATAAFRSQPVPLGSIFCIRSSSNNIYFLFIVLDS